MYNIYSMYFEVRKDYISERHFTNDTQNNFMFLFVSNQ